MKGSTNGIRGTGYTELEATPANLTGIGQNQIGMLILDNISATTSNVVNGIVYFRGPMESGTTGLTSIWGAINRNDNRFNGVLYNAHIESNTLIIRTWSSTGNSAFTFTSAELLAHARLYVSDLPVGGGEPDLLTCTVSMMEAVA